MENQTSRYIAVATTDNQYAVREIYPGGSDLHVIGACRNFTTFDEADQVARDIAAGKFPYIRPAGGYIPNR